MTEYCPLCLSKGRNTPLQYYQMNLSEATKLCSDKKCPYPLSVGFTDVFIKRNFKDIRTSCKTSQHNYTVTPEVKSVKIKQKRSATSLQDMDSVDEFSNWCNSLFSVSEEQEASVMKKMDDISHLEEPECNVDEFLELLNFQANMNDEKESDQNAGCEIDKLLEERLNCVTLSELDDISLGTETNMAKRDLNSVVGPPSLGTENSVIRTQVNSVAGPPSLGTENSAIRTQVNSVAGPLSLGTENSVIRTQVNSVAGPPSLGTENSVIRTQVNSVAGPPSLGTENTVMKTEINSVLGATNLETENSVIKVDLSSVLGAVGLGTESSMIKGEVNSVLGAVSLRTENNMIQGEVNSVLGANYGTKQKNYGGFSFDDALESVNRKTLRRTMKSICDAKKIKQQNPCYVQDDITKKLTLMMKKKSARRKP